MRALFFELELPALDYTDAHVLSVIDAIEEELLPRRSLVGTLTLHGYDRGKALRAMVNLKVSEQLKVVYTLVHLKGWRNWMMACLDDALR